jgi:glycosyltransferase involved in cell wall biosynthesis
MNPFFSIIVPCCDVAQYLRESLDSVVKQPFSDWECLLGVEESKDDTEKIAREYAAKDPRFKVFTGPRSGSCSASRNTGIDMATGEYIIFLDGDDTIVEGSLQRLHDKIAARPGADLYPCAIRMYDDSTGETLELRDNYPQTVNEELSGTEATLLVAEHCAEHSCPMLQLSVFSRRFLVENNLKCVHGLRRQDSEFSPRALYLSRKVVPLHELFYQYRIRPNSIGTGARGEGYFHKDWAIIMRSLLAFNAKVSLEQDFDPRVSQCWANRWLQQIFYFWFSPENMKTISRAKRIETLKCLFPLTFDDFNCLLRSTSLAKRIAGHWVETFVRHPVSRTFIELLFRLYFTCARFRHNKRHS